LSPHEGSCSGSTSRAGVARGVALNATSPVFSAVLAAFVLRERVTRSHAIGIALAAVAIAAIAAGSAAG